METLGKKIDAQWRNAERYCYVQIRSAVQIYRKRRRLFRDVPEHLFFGAVIISAGLAAKLSDVVERLIAIPASTFRLECRNAE
jgi:hypothetical protein